MEQRKGCVYGAVPPELIIREHDALMAVDIENGQKTGHFLDQQENRGHLRPYSAGRTVLDLCCHTGGFSIHAALYGAAHVQAVDVSETALAMVRGNAARNGVADRFKVLVGDLSDKASGQYNIITANIVAAAILSLAPHVPVLMAPDARFIASGIIDERKDEVLAGLRAAGLAPVEVKEKRGWVCIICKKSETKEA